MATNAIYEKRGTSITWTNTGGDKLLNAKDLGTATGRLGAFYDRGAGAAPCEYEVRIYTQWAANPATTDTLRFVTVESDGTHEDAGVAYHASNDAAITLAEINACYNGMGAVLAHTADANEKGTKRIVRISSRYFAPAIYNTSATKKLANTDSVTAIVYTPLYPDVQAAA